MKKGGVTERITYGSYVDAITMRLGRSYSDVPAVRDPLLLVKRLELRRPLTYVGWIIQGPPFKSLRPSWPAHLLHLRSN